MNEHPIIFSSEMVCAIRDGRKTMTRRVIKPQPIPCDQLGDEEYDGPTQYFVEGAELRTPLVHGSKLVHCPYGVPGDRLWVRESFAYVSPDEFERPIEECKIEYRADLPHGCTDGPGEWPRESYDDPEALKWRPSIHMPRWASRLTLEIVSVRVERLQDITESDAIAEGAPLGRVRGYGRLGMQSHREGFIELWDSINAKRGYGWDTNPWVWVIEFKRVNV